MKKIIITLILLVVGFTAFAQSKVWVEGGWLPQTAKVEYPDTPDGLLVENIFYVDLGINYVWKILYVCGGVKTYMVPKSDELNFLPFYTFYTFGAGVSFSGLTIGWEHGCAHSVGALGYLIDPLYPVDSSFDKIFIRKEIKF